MRRLLLIGVALLSLALPGVAGAATSTTISPSSGSSPFSLGVPQATQSETTTTPTVVTTATSADTNGSFSALDAIIIGAAVVLVIVGVVFYVMRDSRQAARHIRGSAVTANARAGSKPAPRTRKLSAQEKRRRKRGRAPRRR